MHFDLHVSMNSQIYFTLPSNSSMEYFPNDTLASFQTKPAQPIELTGDWEVALYENQYPCKWYHLKEGAVHENRVYYNTPNYGVFQASIIPPGYYPSVQHLVSVVNKCLKADTRGDIWLTFSELSRKVTVHVANNAKFGCSAPFTYMIGSDKTDLIIDKVTEAQLTADLEAGFHASYVYRDSLEPQLVCGSKVAL